MKENEFQEETTKTKPAPQFNARITDELKQSIDEIGVETGKSKPELLDELVRVYQTKKANEEFSSMDLSKYDNLSNPLKESVHNAFIHILNAVNGNLSTLKQSAIHLEEEKRDFIIREVDYKAEIEGIKNNSNSEILALKEKNEEVVSVLHSEMEVLKRKLDEREAKNSELQKEFTNISKIADQVEVVTSENKQLREVNHTMEANHKSNQSALEKQNQQISAELVELKQELFKSEHRNDSINEEIVALKELLSQEKSERASNLDTYKNELDELTQKLSDIQSKYNQSLGKLEILEKGNSQ